MFGVQPGLLMRFFVQVELPTTIEEVQQESLKRNQNFWDFAQQQILNGVSYNMVHQKGDRFWPSQKLFADAIEQVDEDIAKLQQLRETLVRQKSEMAKI